MPVKVLIVDDEVDFLNIMAERMRARGIDVSTATSAEDAINLVGLKHYDVIIMDFMMPAMNGFKALKLLKAKKADTPIILMTGNVPGELILQAKQNGALDVVEKPADLQTLIEKIKQVTIKKTTRKPTSPRKR